MFFNHGKTFAELGNSLLYANLGRVTSGLYFFVRDDVVSLIRVSTDVFIDVDKIGYLRLNFLAKLLQQLTKVDVISASKGCHKKE